MAIQLTRFPLMGYQVEAHVASYNSMATIVGLPLRYHSTMTQHGENIQPHMQMQPSGPQAQHFGGVHGGQHFQQQPPHQAYPQQATMNYQGTHMYPNRQYVH